VSCHLLGNHISAPTIGLLLDLTESHICEIYNELHETNYTSIEQLSYDDEPEKWSQERLIKEYKKLQDNMARRKRNKSIKSRVKKNEAN
jgi:hypothetical protein